MNAKEVKEKILLFLEEQLHSEYNERNKLNKYIHSISIEGIEEDADYIAEIMNSVNAIDISQSKTYTYRDIIEFVNDIDIPEE